jgi:hypothetical protein
MECVKKLDEEELSLLVLNDEKLAQDMSSMPECRYGSSCPGMKRALDRWSCLVRVWVG